MIKVALTENRLSVWIYSRICYDLKYGAAKSRHIYLHLNLPTCSFVGSWKHFWSSWHEHIKRCFQSATTDPFCADYLIPNPLPNPTLALILTKVCGLIVSTAKLHGRFWLLDQTMNSPSKLAIANHEYCHFFFLLLILLITQQARNYLVSFFIK